MLTQNTASQKEIEHSCTTLRVMMVVPQYPYPIVGGLERQAHELAKALRELGVDVQVLSGCVEPGQPSSQIVEGIAVFRIPWSRKKYVRFLRTPFDLFRVLYAQRNSYDVIHLHQHSWFGLYTIMAAKLLQKAILTKLPNIGEFGLPGMAAKGLGRLKLAILLCSDALVAMSRESIAELSQARFPSGRVLITPNGVRLIGVRSRVMHGVVDEQSCRVVFVGRLSEQKRLDVLLVAWSEVVRAAKVRATLELWGDGLLASTLQQQCESLGIVDSVHFCGHVHDVRERLLEVDIFVLPSSAEGNSNAVLEAMAAGLPIVSTCVGGTPMLVGKEGTAFLSAPGDSLALADHLLKLIRNPDLRAKIGSSMRRRVEQHFDIYRIAQTYSSVYRILAAGQRERVKESSNSIVMDEVV